ncbi:MAG: RHS repeat-associated core domain-containing protein [Candidatus Acidiferrales bacterium]
MRNWLGTLRFIKILVPMVFALALSAGRALAQSGDTGYATGFPPNGVFDGSDFDTVAVASGGLHVRVPLVQFKGRGPSMYVGLKYDGLGYTDSTNCTQQECYDRFRKAPGGGWTLELPTGYGVTYSTVNFSTCNTHVGIYAATGVTMFEPDGTSHHFVPDQPMLINPGCFTAIPNGVMYADDGSGWKIRVDPNSGIPINGAVGFDLFKDDGTEVVAVGSGNTLTTTLTDPNGNQITSYNPNDTLTTSTLTLTDTLGRTLSVPQACVYSSQCTMSYTDSNGTAQSIQITSVSVTTSYPTSGCGPPFCTPYVGSEYMPSQITLPNGLQYTFNYFSSSNPSGLYGELLNSTLPTGGSISWTWGQLTADLHTQVSSRTVTANGNNYNWNYVYSTPVPPKTTITDANQNDTVYIFGGSPGRVYSDYTATVGPTIVQSYSGTGGSRTLVKTVTTTYDNTNSPLPRTETTTWALNNQVSQVQTDWDSFNTGQRVISWRNPINKREYAYGTGSSGGLVRTTSFNYLHLTNSTYLNLNIADKPTSKIVYEADGVTVHAKTLYSYDNTTLTATSGVVNHDNTHFSTGNTLRGNSTQIQRWRNTDGALLTTTNYYNDLGNLTQTSDPASHNTYFDYTDVWGQNRCSPASGSTQAFVTKTTNHLNQLTHAAYNSCSSLAASTTDLNSQITTYQYDSMGRRTQTKFPDGGEVDVTYGNTLPINIVTTTKITSQQNKVTTAVLEDRGLVKQTQINSAPPSPILTDTTYDAFGRVASVSNPYQGTSTGTTTYQYDALGRTTKVTKQDGSFATTAYCGSTTLVTDEANHWRRSMTDAQGRMIEVDEPNSTTATVNSNGCPGTGEPIWVTSYAYDVADNLTGVTQSSSRQRSFIYDSLSSLTSSTNPEAGNVTYTYDNEEKLLTKKDARNLTITYGYEALHRLTGKTYSNGDPSVSFSYDSSNCGGVSPCLNIGHRTGMTDVAGSDTWMYTYRTTPNTGVQVTNLRTTSGFPKSTVAQNNLDGSLASLTYPSGRTITYAYDGAARPISALDTANNINYATAGAYAPQGALSALTLGSATGFAGISLSNTYNARLQPNEVKAWSTAGTAFELSYCFTPWDTVHNTCPAAGANNGNVNGITNNLDGNRTQFFGYDQVNRILTAQTTSTFSTSSAKCWGESYVYDTSGGGPWGNLSQINAVSSAYNGCTQEHLSISVGTNNKITSQGFLYDVSGNLLGDGSNIYVWNSESQIKTANTVNYTYDGDGNRVQKSNGKIYWYGVGTEILDESDANGNITDEYVFFGGKRVAHRMVSGGAIYYYAEDMLGTTRVMTTSTGTLCYDADFYPFGGERAPYTNTCSQNYKFEGKERDTETGNDDFGARYYSSTYGRWLSPDWSSVPVAAPYANLNNPQTLNLYAMVSNDPETFADLDGHCCDWQDLKAQAGASVAFLGQELTGAAKGLVNLAPATWNTVATVLNTQTASAGIPADLPMAPTIPLNNLGQVVGSDVATLGVMATGLLGGSPVPAAGEGTVTRYMGTSEASTVETTGSIPNVDAAGNPKAIHVTTDPPMDSAAAAKQTYELPKDPSHRATVPASRVEGLGPTPDGKATTSGGGTQAATKKPIPVKPPEVKKLNP